MSEVEERVSAMEGPEPTSASDESVRMTFEQVLATGQEMVSAELEWARLKAAAIGVAIRNAAVLAVLAVILALAGVTTLLFGIILALTPIIGAVLATLLVAAATMGIALVLVLLARRSLKSIGQGGAA